MSLCENDSDRGLQLKNHATGDVNSSFPRIMCAGMRLEARATPSNGRILASGLVVDEQTVVFRDHAREAAPGRANQCPVDNCGNVDKL